MAEKYEIANELIGKLDRFIRKYYRNRLTRGLLWSITIVAVFFLLSTLSESLFYFSSTVRTILFFSFVVLFLFVFIRLILVPVFQLMKIGRRISHDHAARIIGDHFPEIGDKLINTLQLIGTKGYYDPGSDLLSASIEQKTRSLKVFQFNKAIDVKNNMKYLRMAIAPVAVILLLMILTPGTVSEPAERIFNFDRQFVRPLPFTFELLNKKLVTLQQDDFELQVKFSGEEIPVEVYLKAGDVTYKMARQKGFVFSHNFRSLQGDVTFSVTAGEFSSVNFTLKVLPRPIILNFDLSVSYPAYTGKTNEVFHDQGDVVVPEGTVLNWNFYTKDVSDIGMGFQPALAVKKEREGNRFSCTGVAFSNFSYFVRPGNSNVTLPDSLAYRVTVINDGYPSVFVSETADSILPTSLFFNGTIKDDYGFSDLSFYYSVYEGEDTTGARFTKVNLPWEKNMNNQRFYYNIDLVNLLPEPGKKIMYFFEVKDNDQIHGAKAARSELRTISTPTLAEIAEQAARNAEYMKDEMEKNISGSKSIKKAIDELSKKMVDENNMTWQDRKKMEEIIKAHEKIEERIEDIKKRSDENLENSEKYLETSERILEKQKMLKEMADQIFPEELKKMIEELKALMKQVDKNKLGDLLEKMKMSNRELEKQLDRNLEMMKQLEFERKLDETVNQLRRTAEELEKLAEKTEKPEESQKELLEEHDKLAAKIDSLMSRAEEVKEEGKKLEEPVDLGNSDKAKKDVKEGMSEGKEGLEKNSRKKASGSQKKAAGGMKEMAQQMESANQESEDGQTEEDAQNIRMILESLVQLSFDQEALISFTRNIQRSDPKYNDNVLKQKEFRDKMKVIEDSLTAIAKRQMMIKPIITKELNSINQNIGLVLEAFEGRNIGAAVSRQQFIMTSINNLALLLNEALQKMNEQMASSMQSKSGSKSCNNPSGSGGKKSAKSMKDLQGKIGDQLKKLKEGMEKAGKPGSQGMNDMKGFNKELAKLAAQQEALRQEMQRYQEELGGKGIKDQQGLNEAARDMDQIEKDLVNKRISQETINRQQRIMSRLLESEKAEQTRDKEERRESVEAKNQKTGNLGQNFEYNRIKRASIDQIQLMIPALNPFYKNKVNEYSVKIEK